MRLALLVILAACGKPPAQKERCTPGRYVFCRCQDLSAGTQLCNDDGVTFAECVCTQKSTENIISKPNPTPEEHVGICQRAPIQLVDESSFDGDTADAKAMQVGAGDCAAATSAEESYAVTPSINGKLNVEVSSHGALDPIVYIRNEDCESGKQLACASGSGAGGTETASADVLAGHTYHVFVDGAGTTAGAFSVHMTVTSGPVCGDGHLDSGEGCDGGVSCTADCVPSDDIASADMCPGVAVSVWQGKPLSFAGTTVGFGNDYHSEQCGFGGSGPDRIYAVTPHADGYLTGKVASSGGMGLYILEGGCSPGTSLVCNDTTDDGTVLLPVTKDVVYWLFVDSFSAAAPFTLSLSLD